MSELPHPWIDLNSVTVPIAFNPSIRRTAVVGFSTSKNARTSFKYHHPSRRNIFLRDGLKILELVWH